MSAQSTQGLEAYLDIEERESRELNGQTHPVRRMLKLVRKYPAPLYGGLAMVLLGTFATLMEPRLFGYAIDEAVIPRKWDKLTDLAILFLLVICIRVASMIAQAYLFEMLGQKVTLDLRMRVFSHLQRLSVSAFDKNPAGRLLTRITNDVASVADMFSSGFVLVISNTLLVQGILIWLMILDLKLGLIAASVFPGLLIASAYFSKRLKIAYREARSKLSALNAFLAENLIGMKIVHLFNRQKIHLERFDRINSWYADAQISSVRVFALFQPTITLCSGISLALVIWFGGGEAWNGNIKLGVLAAYFSYTMALFQPVREIADKWNVFVSAMASAERIFGILDWPVEDGMKSAAVSKSVKSISELKGHIVFENVWFAYEGENWVLKDFNLEIQPGMRVGVVGHTGAGKTTLISLLMRFYDPQKGRILLDGKDLKEYDKRALRASIGLVQQDVFIFSGTLKDNITFWSEKNDVEEKLKSLGVDFSTELQERGGNLSLGQRQLLSFARALTSDPKIWILDEATANMDSFAEQVIGRALETAAKNRTVIFIAHRLATVRDADQIIVLHKGSLIEKGRHPELVRLKGLYARLYRYQKAQQEAQQASVTQ